MYDIHYIDKSICSSAFTRIWTWRSGKSSSSTPNWLIHVFMDFALCTGAQSCWNRKGPSANCFHKVGSMKLSKISWYAEEFRIPFTGTKGPSPAPGKHGCSSSAMETHSMKFSTHCSWANLKATWSLEVCRDWLCKKLATSEHYAPQHPLTPLCHFSWPTTPWLSCCHSQSLPLCFNTTDSWLWNIS